MPAGAHACALKALALLMQIHYRQVSCPSETEPAWHCANLAAVHTWRAPLQAACLLLQLVLDPNSGFDELIPVDDDFLQNYVSELSGMNVDTVRPCCQSPFPQMTSALLPGTVC
jgi:hypothetical protein